MDTSIVKGVYENAVDRESAFEILRDRGTQEASAGSTAASPTNGTGAPDSAEENGVTDVLLGKMKDILLGSTGPPRRP